MNWLLIEVKRQNIENFSYMEIIMLSVARIGVGVYQILANFLQSAITHSCQIGIKDFNNF